MPYLSFGIVQIWLTDVNLGAMTTIIIFLIILSLLVLVHEWGHFVTARMFGMKVYEFGLGFPPRAGGWYKDPKTGKWKWSRGRGKNKLSETVGGEDREHPDEFPSTLYSLNWLPLGGFVKIKGENGEQAADVDSFGHYGACKKLIVLCAGVFMNFVLAAVLLGIGFMIGLPTDASVLEDPQAIVVEQPAVLIQQVQPNSPAQAAGLQFGDKILQIDETKIKDTTSMIALVGTIGSSELDLMVERVDGTVETLQLTPQILGEDERPRLGVMLADAGVVKYPWYIALYKGFTAAAIAVVNICIGFFFIIKGLLMGQGVGAGVAGPVGIAVVVGQSAELGLSYLLNVTAMISLSLAVINILPIPALDGGRALFVIIEKIIRRPVPMRYEQLAHTIGFVLLMVLIVVVTVKDVVGLF